MSQIAGRSGAVETADKKTTLTEVIISPYPSPETLKMYDEINPGYSNRLITMAEKTLDEMLYQDRQKAMLAFKKENTVRWGLAVALLAILPIYGISFYLIYNGHPTQGSAVVIGTTLASLAGVFVGKRSGVFDTQKDTDS
jgi:uncharacterized membrane protein